MTREARRAGHRSRTPSGRRTAPAPATASAAAIRAAVLGTVLCALAFPFGAAPASAGEFRFEAEQAFASGADAIIVNVGGDPIGPKFCGDASGGMAVEGLDHPGDYIAFRLKLTEPWIFVDSLRCAGEAEKTWKFKISAFPYGEDAPVLVDSLDAVMGYGYG